jgi:hypothetical protein
MNCPHCQKELPANYEAGWCPFCGRDLKPGQANPPSQRAFESNYVSWPKFFIVLLAPAVACFLALAVDVGGLAVILGLFGALISGLMCARMIMEGVNLAGSKKALAYLGLAFLLCCLSCFLCFIGCISASTVSKHGF